MLIPRRNSMGHGDIPIFDLAAETMPDTQRVARQAGRLSALVDRLLTAGGPPGPGPQGAPGARGGGVAAQHPPRPALFSEQRPSVSSPVPPPAPARHPAL